MVLTIADVVGGCEVALRKWQGWLLLLFYVCVAAVCVCVWLEWHSMSTEKAASFEPQSSGVRSRHTEVIKYLPPGMVEVATKGAFFLDLIQPPRPIAWSSAHRHSKNNGQAMVGCQFKCC
jgi:hypothetical protein